MPGLDEARLLENIDSHFSIRRWEEIDKTSYADVVRLCAELQDEKGTTMASWKLPAFMPEKPAGKMISICSSASRPRKYGKRMWRGISGFSVFFQAQSPSLRGEPFAVGRHLVSLQEALHYPCKENLLPSSRYSFSEPVTGMEPVASIFRRISSVWASWLVWALNTAM